MRICLIIFSKLFSPVSVKHAIPYKLVKAEAPAAFLAPRTVETWLLSFVNLPKSIDVHFQSTGLTTMKRFDQLCSQKRWEGVNYHTF